MQGLLTLVYCTFVILGGLDDRVIPDATDATLTLFPRGKF